MSKKIKLFGPRSLQDASRYAVLDSDGVYRVPCVNCGVKMTVFEYQAGHDTAQENGGANTAENHFPICGKEFNSCNQRQGTRNGADFLPAENYAKVLAARALPFNNELVAQWHKEYLEASASYFKRHASKAERMARM